VWKAGAQRPLLLIAGGSGIVPLMGMIRHRSLSGANVPARLLYSSRIVDDIIYRTELDRLASSNAGLTVAHALTRSQPSGWQGYARRIDREMMREVAPVSSTPLRAHETPVHLVCRLLLENKKC